MCNMCYIRYTSSPPPTENNTFCARKPIKTAKSSEKIGKTSEKIGKTSEKIGKTLWSVSLLRRAKQTSSNISRCQLDARSASRAGGRKATRDNLSNHTNKSMGFDF